MEINLVHATYIFSHKLYKMLTLYQLVNFLFVINMFFDFFFLQISSIYNNKNIILNLFVFSVTFARTVTILPFVREITLIPKNYKKSLKIPKGQSESVNRRRTDNTMAKRTNNDLQNIHIKVKIE